MFFQCINIRQVPRNLANVNAWKPMFDPYWNNKEDNTWHTTSWQIATRPHKGQASLEQPAYNGQQ